MEHITFSDNVGLSGTNSVAFEESDTSSSEVLSLEEYCKKNPGALECLEYDV